MKRAGFTIVELLIVIVVIAILAAITIVAYNGIQQNAMTSLLKSDISNAAKQMELAKADTETYPTSFPSTLKVSSNVSISLSQTTGGFCINGEHKQNTSIRWRYESTAGGLQQGLCSGAVIAGSEPGLNPNLVSDTTFLNVGSAQVSDWRLARSSGSLPLSTRAGTQADPYPSRPVLVMNNTASASTTWAYFGGPVQSTQIISGRTYVISYYIRLAAGAYNTWFPQLGVLDGNGQNVTLSQSTSVTPNSTWQLTSRSVTAQQNGQSSNTFYGSVSVPQIQSNNFTLEFQGFELREQ